MPTKKAPKASAPLVASDDRAAFEHFLPLATARVKEGRLPARGARDVAVLRANVERGTRAVLGAKEAILAKQPTADFVAIEELLGLVAALDYAAGRVPVPLADGEVPAALAELRPLRLLGLGQLDVLAGLGLIPADRVAKIREGRGNVDAARDGVAIPGLFAEFEKEIGGKHPFTAEHFDTMSRLGNQLIRALLPQGAKAVKEAPAAEALLRDAFYGEVLERYESARELAVVAFGLRDLDENVPLAHAHARAPKKGKTAKAPDA
jgi:hypothetical protein